MAGRRAVNTCIVFTQVGFATTYLVFFGNNVDTFFRDEMKVQLGTPAWIGIGALTIAPVTLLRDLTRISFLSAFANVALIYTLIVVLVSEFGELHEHGAQSFDAFNGATLAIFFGNAVFAYEGVGTVIPIQQSMAKPEHFVPLFTFCVVSVSVLFELFSIVGLATWGNFRICQSITNSQPDSVWVRVVRIAYSFSLLFSYPLQVLSPRPQPHHAPLSSFLRFRFRRPPFSTRSDPISCFGAVSSACSA